METSALKKYETKWFEEGEQKKAVDISWKMIVKGKNIEEIIELTGLSIEEIHSL